MVVERTCGAVTGDTFCAPNGKQIVVTVLPNELMHRIDDVPVKVVISTTTLVKRDTVGEVLEAWAGTGTGLAFAHDGVPRP